VTWGTGELSEGVTGIWTRDYQGQGCDMNSSIPLFKRCSAEFMGTFWLVFGGCGSAVLAAAIPGVGIGLLGVSLAFGLTVLTMAYAIGHISGCHLIRRFQSDFAWRNVSRQRRLYLTSWPR
jgi:hypothetical protein